MEAVKDYLQIGRIGDNLLTCARGYTLWYGLAFFFVVVADVICHDPADLISYIYMAVTSHFLYLI